MASHPYHASLAGDGLLGYGTPSPPPKTRSDLGDGSLGLGTTPPTPSPWTGHSQTRPKTGHGQDLPGQDIDRRYPIPPPTTPIAPPPPVDRITHAGENITFPRTRGIPPAVYQVLHLLFYPRGYPIHGWGFSQVRMGCTHLWTGGTPSVDGGLPHTWLGYPLS